MLGPTLLGRALITEGALGTVGFARSLAIFSGPE